MEREDDVDEPCGGRTEDRGRSEVKKKIDVRII